MQGPIREPGADSDEELSEVTGHRAIIILRSIILAGTKRTIAGGGVPQLANSKARLSEYGSTMRAVMIDANPGLEFKSCVTQMYGTSSERTCQDGQGSDMQHKTGYTIYVPGWFISMR